MYQDVQEVQEVQGDLEGWEVTAQVDLEGQVGHQVVRQVDQERVDQHQ